MLGQELRTPVDLIFGLPPEPGSKARPGLDYFSQLRERLRETHELTLAVLAEAGIKQKRAYYIRCSGEDFAPGAC
ncbi:hypothetical protein LDENG_00246080, partial [Lucifuga dentata]